VLGGGINDVLLTGLVVAIADWCRRRGRGSGAAVLLDLEWVLWASKFRTDGTNIV
jgi:hypothetical protein